MDEPTTYKFTEAEARQLREAYERIEKKIDLLLERGKFWRLFLRNVTHRISGAIDSELEKAE